jgi:glucosamine--fructose-6-phosphate aminotransferase (isomerizing)
MCGIVGYSGPGNAFKPVLEGLTRLEYRGYDSAGICYVKNKNLENIKREGKLENLKNALDLETINSHQAIGHTRWATHGKVNEVNAHPHINETFGVVHNGIIENAPELKKGLISEGYEFKSETDSETFLVLVTKFFKETKDIRKAILKSYEIIEGNSAFVIMHVESENIYSIKRSAPLVCGENKSNSEVYASSDPYALVGFADIIYFPENGVLCESVQSGQGIHTNFYEADLTPSTRFKTQENEKNMVISSKGEFEHYMLKEIHEQPKLILGLLDHYRNYSKDLMNSIKGYKPGHVNISACGTAWHAGLVIKNFLEVNNNQRVNIELASEFRYKHNILGENDLGLFISQSGETADTLATVELCKEAGLDLFSIVNTQGSTVYRECDKNFLIHAGIEIGVASTKAFTQQVLTGYLISQAIAGKFEENSIDEEFKLLSIKVNDLLKREDEIKSIALEIYNKNGFIFTGRGKYFPIALEGALKLKEIAYVHAEGYAAGELKHGPIALIDENMVNLALVGPELMDKTISNIEEVKARRGIIVTVGPKDSEYLKDLSDYYFELDFEGLDQLSPVYVNVVMQLISYHIAKLKGTDIDKPRNLAKSVTVE